MGYIIFILVVVIAVQAWYNVKITRENDELGEIEMQASESPSNNLMGFMLESFAEDFDLLVNSLTVAQVKTVNKKLKKAGKEIVREEIDGKKVNVFGDILPCEDIQV